MSRILGLQRMEVVDYAEREVVLGGGSCCSASGCSGCSSNSASSCASCQAFELVAM